MYRRILVPVDGSDTSNLALREAIKLAKGQRITLLLIHVVDMSTVYMADMPFLIDKFQKEMRQSGRKILAGCATTTQRARIKFDTNLIVIDNPMQRIGDVINKEAKRWRADLVMIGTHGRRGINHLLLGSVAEGVIRSATKPVLVIRGR